MSLGRPLNEYPDNYPHQYAYQTCEIGQWNSEIFGIICQFYRIAAKGVIVNSINSGVSESNVTQIVHIVEKFILLNRWNGNCDILIHFGMAASRTRLVHQKRQFCEFNWLPWQPPLTDRKKLNVINKSFNRLPILKFLWRSVHWILRNSW